MGSSSGQCDGFLIDAEDPRGGGRPVESQASMSGANGQIGSIGYGAGEIQMADVFGNVGFDVCSETTNGWRRRVWIGEGPVVRDLNPNRKAALELPVRAYAEKRNGTFVKPTIRTSFDSIDEAYEFYNIYSWECSFRVLLSSSRLNVDRNKAMQEIICACAGKPLKENTRSTRCGCTAMIRLLRSSDNGWYISEHKEAHNHPLSLTCGKKMHWKSHRHIDWYAKDLVKQLGDNNVGLGKVFSIVGSFFGSVENVPFTKRSLKTLCRKLNKEQSDFDAMKIMDSLSEMKANDPDFKYTVQVDEESRIKTLMWVTAVA